MSEMFEFDVYSPSEIAHRVETVGVAWSVAWYR